MKDAELLSTTTPWHRGAFQPATEQALKRSGSQPDCMPGCQEVEAAHCIKPHLTSGCVSKSCACKKQEVINLCYLELMRQTYCSDWDIMLVMSDMMANFKGEQNGNHDL